MKYKLGLTEELIKNRLQESARLKKEIVDSIETVKIIAKIAEVIIQAYRKGKKVILFGNGGSAADAQHIAAELVGGKLENGVVSSHLIFFILKR